MASTKIRLGAQSDLNAAGGVITNVGAPISSTDAANKQYVDNFAQGADWKQSVRVATTANGSMATAFANGEVIDGITLVTGDRILIKDQSTLADNGIYIVQASGTPVRSEDADEDGELTAGSAVFVEEGDTQNDTGWVVTSDGDIEIGTDDIVFTQFTGVGSIIAGDGLTKSGNTLNVESGNGAIVVGADDITFTAADASITIDAGGAKVTPGTGGQVSLTNGSGVVTPTTLSGDVDSVSDTGSVTLGSTIQRTEDFVDRETPTGSVNGSNTAFTLANTPISGSEHVYLNGLLQDPGAGNDYTISGNTITYLSAPLTGDKIRVSYRK